MRSSLVSLNGRDFACAVRLGNEQQSPEHQLTIRFTADRGMVHGHILASAPDGTPLVVRDALCWDEVTRRFRITAESDVEWLAGRLDPLTRVSEVIMNLTTGLIIAALRAADSILNPNVILFGGILTIVLGLLLWGYIATTFLWYAGLYVVLPAGIVCFVANRVWRRRVQRLRNAIWQTANAAYSQA